MMESAESYREKKAIPYLKKIVEILKSLYHDNLEISSKLNLLQNRYAKKCEANENLCKKVKVLEQDNCVLAEKCSDYDRVRNALGLRYVDNVVNNDKMNEQRVLAEKERKEREQQEKLRLEQKMRRKKPRDFWDR